jgi:integrase/recombinase XerD
VGAGSRLRVLDGGVAVQAPATTDPWAFQAQCVEAFVASWHARGFSPVTIANDVGLLERTLAALGRPAWEVTPDDIDRVVGALATAGRATSTRREYVQIFKGFHRFLQARKAAEIEVAFGVRLVCPVDEFNAARHVGDDSPALLPPPSPERVATFFDFLKARIATARKYAPAARDYALFRTLYHAGLRSEEAALLERADVHLGRGPFGKLHVRFGKGARTSGPQWVPLLDGLDLVLRWFLDDMRGKLPDSGVLFADESGGSLHPGSIRNRLRYLLALEGRPEAERFSPHGLRRACATHLYERGVDLVAIQQLLGHWTVSSTMRYVRPSEAFIEDAYRRAVTTTLGALTGPAGAGTGRTGRREGPVAAADSRGPAGGVDRRAAAAAAGRAGGAGAVGGVGVGAADQAARPGEARDPGGAVHRVGVQP